MSISASIPVLVSAASAITPDLFEDFSPYTSTANMLADPRNIYRAGEDKSTTRIFLAVGEGINGGNAMEFRYPPQQTSPGLTISRALDIATLFGNSVKQVWWEQIVRFSDNFDINDPAYTQSYGALKWMHGDVQGPNASRFGGQLQSGAYQNGFLLGYPDNEQFINSIHGFDCTSMFGSGQWHTWRVHYKVNDPIGTPNGKCSIILPNGVTSINENLNAARTNIFKLAVQQNMNEKPAMAASMSVFYGSEKVYLTDPGWGI